MSYEDVENLEGKIVESLIGLTAHTCSILFMHVMIRHQMGQCCKILLHVGKIESGLQEISGHGHYL